MTFNLVIGILTFYRSLKLNHPLSIFGGTFLDYNNIVDSKITTEDVNGYTVNVNGIIYLFNGPSDNFMRGLLTAAIWNNMDPHKYITNVTETRIRFVSPNGDTILVYPQTGYREIIEKILLDY